MEITDGQTDISHQTSSFFFPFSLLFFFSFFLWRSVRAENHRLSDCHLSHSMQLLLLLGGGSER